MTNLQKKVASAIAVGALFLNTALPVFAETTTILINGNSADSDNTANVTQATTTTVVQDNTANISNDVNASADTGKNDANYNTGGNVSVTTGAAATGVAVTNTANSNVADVNGCCTNNTDVEVSGNGYNSDNTVNTTVASTNSLFQDNKALLNNHVDANADTGKNDANYNNGGNVWVNSGPATTSVTVDNTANSNWAKVGDGNGGSSLSMKILGNSADSDNTVDLTYARSLSVVQDNLAAISNHVDASANTGKNDANYNNGGNVSVNTGAAATGVAIDNMANFNFADLNCGCILDVLAKVAGNGYNSDNTINATLYDAKTAFQTNDYGCEEGLPLESLSFIDGGQHHGCNKVHANSDTGKNDVKYSGGALGADPSIETGNAAAIVDVSDTANSNVLTEGNSLPELPGFNFNFNLGFNLLHLWGLMSGNQS